MAGAAAVAGCGGSQSPTSASQQSPPRASPAYTSAQLKGALLARVNGATPASAAESGDYGTLPDVQTSKQTMNAVTGQSGQVRHGVADRVQLGGVHPRSGVGGDVQGRQ